MRERAAVIIVIDYRIALIKRVKNNETYYVFLGGGIENGETSEFAAIREAFEELGVYVEINKLLKVINLEEK